MYKTILNQFQTEEAIGIIKSCFSEQLAKSLSLVRVTAPLFVECGTGINDDLNGIEKPVSFQVPAMDNKTIEVVQSLAKWKRLTLADLGFVVGTGLYTDMNAIRPFEALSKIHSLYVDQWDWEKIINPSDRNLDFLKDTVKSIYSVIKGVEEGISLGFDELTPFLPEDIHFIHTEELEARFPNIPPRDREREICKELGAVFLIGIGNELKNGLPHDGRAPDYDDWSTPTEEGTIGLNGDILVYNPILQDSFEISSMGIRVNPESLKKQLAIRENTDRENLYFHKRLLNGELPQTIGGGIGQSRLCMLFLQKAHIGEIQASLWPDSIKEECKINNISLL